MTGRLRWYGVLLLPPLVACSGAADADHPRDGAPGVSVGAAGPGAVVQQSSVGDESLPEFVPGTYDLVLERGEPVFDDSVAVQRLVENNFDWPLIERARTAADSMAIVAAHVSRYPGVTDIEHDLSRAESVDDSARQVRSFLGALACEEWRSSESVVLEADGSFTRRVEMREYCRGRTPAFSRRVVDGSPSRLEACESLTAPVAGRVAHRTCARGSYWNGMYPYRYAGDTLVLGSDCDGSDTFVLRPPDVTPPLHARKSDASGPSPC